MIKSARHDYIELSYVYGGAVALVLFLSAIAMPIDVSRFGLIVPQKEDNTGPSEIYAATAFDALDVKAKSYVVYDLLTKQVIASKNADEQLPLASISKLMMAYTALANHDKATKITINPQSIEGTYDLGLKKGQVWTLGELLKYTLVFSSNDGAHEIADNLSGRQKFIQEMNDESQKLGLNLSFTDPAGLDENGKIGGMGDALDVAKLFAVVRNNYPEIMDATTKTRVTTRASNGLVSGIPNTNQDVNNFFGTEVSKTGFTDSAGGNLGMIFDVALGHPVAIVVLGSTHEARFSDMETLYKALVASLK